MSVDDRDFSCTEPFAEIAGGDPAASSAENIGDIVGIISEMTETAESGSQMEYNPGIADAAADGGQTEYNPGIADAAAGGGQMEYNPGMSDTADSESRNEFYPASCLEEWVRSEACFRDRSAEIEDTIRKNKHFHRRLFSKFAKACKDYRLVLPGDCIAVCISGGKDSMLMAKLFQELKRHNKVPFELTFLVMDPGYNEINRLLIERNCAMMGVPVTIFETKIFDAVDNVGKNPCYLCARMRRGHLYNKAKELGCNKIALGHHYDDVIETILMGMLYGSQIQTMMPKLHSENFEGMELIRPMYLIREDDVKEWRDFCNLHFLQCACHFTETCSTLRDDGTAASKRMEIKQLIKTLKETNPYVEGNIFKSVENVNLRTIMAYKQNGVKHYFLDEY